MDDIPRTLAYVFDVCERYEAFADFKSMLLGFGLRADPALLKTIQ